MARTFTGPSAEKKITASIIALMEKGVSPWRQPWVSGASCHDNLVSGHRYRGANPLLLQIGQLARDAELPFWWGVGEARRFGLFPRKGSKAAYVYRPAPCTKEVLWPDGSVTKDAWISRLGRDLSGSFGSTAYAREELVAELAASLICQRLQIGSDVASHAAYLASWIRILGESPKALLSVLGEARKAADLIAPEEELVEAKPLAVPS
jgi:antirestriction protein ArdC